MKKYHLLHTLLLLYTSLSFAQRTYLIPFRDGDKWGYCDTAGRMVIPVQYDYANCFWTNRAAVTKGTLDYLIDPKGKVILSGNFSISDPLEKFTRINKGEKFGLIDVLEGKFILQPIYTGIYDQGLLVLVKDVNGKYGLYHIGLRKWILPLKYQDIDLHGDHIVLQNGQKKVGYTVSTTGKLHEENIPDKVPEEVMFADHSYQGNIFTTEGKVGYLLKTMDTETGRLISVDTIPAIFDSLAPVSIRSLMIAKKNGRSGMIDLKGKTKIPFLYDEVKEVRKYSDDSIYLIRKDGKWGLTQFENILLPCEFDEIIRDSINGNGFYLKKVRKAGFYVYSDQNKLYNYLIACKYAGVQSYIYKFGPTGDNHATHGGMKGQPPFYCIQVNYAGAKFGFVGMNGNEFFK